METLWARRRPILALALALVVALLAVITLRGTPAAAPQQSAEVAPTATLPAFYRFVIAGPPRGATAHIGDTLLFSLQPQRLSTTQATAIARARSTPTASPAPFICIIAFYGPYDTTERALSALPTLPNSERPDGAPPTPVLSITPPTGDWLGAPFQVAMPMTLATGYYVWVGGCPDSTGGNTMKDVVLLLP